MTANAQKSTPKYILCYLVPQCRVTNELHFTEVFIVVLDQ